jgi:hypothetical protein
MMHFINPSIFRHASLSTHASLTWIVGCPMGNFKYKCMGINSLQRNTGQIASPHISYSGASWPRFDPHTEHLECSGAHAWLRDALAIRVFILVLHCMDYNQRRYIFGLIVLDNNQWLLHYWFLQCSFHLVILRWIKWICGAGLSKLLLQLVLKHTSQFAARRSTRAGTIQ